MVSPTNVPVTILSQMTLAQLSEREFGGVTAAGAVLVSEPDTPC
jgi:hypothetical protein